MKIGYGVEKGPKNLGKLTVDNEGYYSVTIGALNIGSRNGVFYNGGPVVQALFKKGSSFAARLASSFIESEYDHPDYSLIEGTSRSEIDAKYMQRLLVIDPNKVCGSFKEIELVETTDYDYPSKNPIIIIKGKFKPSGPYGDMVKKLLNDPSVNTAFSLRCWRRCDDSIGIKQCNITIPVTFDFVPTGELPGIAIADKANSIGLETLATGSIDTVDIDIEDLVAGLEILNDKALEKEVKSLMNQCNGNKCILNW